MASSRGARSPLRADRGGTPSGRQPGRTPQLPQGLDQAGRAVQPVQGGGVGEQHVRGVVPGDGRPGRGSASVHPRSSTSYTTPSPPGSARGRPARPPAPRSPVSSRTSRSTACSGDSPASTRPPGSDHRPRCGSRPRRTSSSRPRRVVHHRADARARPASGRRSPGQPGTCGGGYAGRTPALRTDAACSIHLAALDDSARPQDGVAR